jgi:hypothetical protein
MRMPRRLSHKRGWDKELCARTKRWWTPQAHTTLLLLPDQKYDTTVYYAERHAREEKGEEDVYCPALRSKSIERQTSSD